MSKDSVNKIINVFKNVSLDFKDNFSKNLVYYFDENISEEEIILKFNIEFDRELEYLIVMKKQKNNSSVIPKLRRYELLADDGNPFEKLKFTDENYMLGKIYDLIIKRELEDIFRTICEFLVVSAILMGIYYVIDKIYSNGVNITMPEEVNVYYYDDNLSYGYDIKISDQELINELIKAELIPSSYSGIQIIIDGKHYLAKNVSEELLKKIDDYAEYNDLKDEFTVDNILHITSNYNSRVVIPNTIELKEMLIDYMKDYEYNPNVIDCYIDLYKYENHELRQVSIEVGNNKEIFNLVKNYFNDSFLSNYEGVIDHISNLEDGELLKIVRSFPTELSLFMQGHKHDELTGDVVILYSGGDRFYIDRDVFMNDFLMKYGDNVEEQNN